MIDWITRKQQDKLTRVTSQLNQKLEGGVELWINRTD